MDWDGGVWTKTDSKGKSEPQYEIKKNIEQIAQIDIEKLQFLLQMIKNMSFDVAGGNFINLNGSIIRDGKIHFQSRREGREWDDENNDFKTVTTMLPEAKSSTPLSLDEVFILTDWGFIYCGIVELSQFMFIQGGLHWLWSDTGHLSRMAGWRNPQKPQFTKLVIGKAIPTDWYQSKRDVDIRRYGGGKYTHGEPTLHTSNYARPTEYHFITSGLTTEDIVNMVDEIPTFDEYLKKTEYGNKKGLEEGANKIVEDYKKTLAKQSRTWQPEWLERRRYEFLYRIRSNYEDFIIRRGSADSDFVQRYSLPTKIMTEYGLPCDSAFSLKNGDITISQCSAEYPHRLNSVTEGYGTISVNAWADDKKSSWRRGRKNRIVSDWRTSVFDNEMKYITHWDEDREESQTDRIQNINEIANFGATFYQYKMSQGILNRMVL
tara:strand:+ start:1527 stop:2825 length:1299 start_codon:yes stop_codon:yes gene_type:complete